jgi:hypothetical protein
MAGMPMAAHHHAAAAAAAAAAGVPFALQGAGAGGGAGAGAGGAAMQGFKAGVHPGMLMVGPTGAVQMVSELLDRLHIPRERA